MASLNTLALPSTTTEPTIERVGTIAGRWPKYAVIVNGLDLGTVRRTKGGWLAGEIDVDTQEAAEAALVQDAHLTGKLATATSAPAADATTESSTTGAAKAQKKLDATNRALDLIEAGMVEGGPAVRRTLEAEFWLSKRGGAKTAAEKQEAGKRLIDLIDDAIELGATEFEKSRDRALVVMEAIEREFWIMRRGAGK